LSSDLRNLSGQLQSGIKAIGPVQRQSEIALLALCQQCSAATTELEDALQKLRAKNTSTASSLAAALKAVWKDSKIEAMSDNLKDVRSQITLATLLCIWYFIKTFGLYRC
jgi:hypothetical protein